MKAPKSEVVPEAMVEVAVGESVCTLETFLYGRYLQGFPFSIPGSGVYTKSTSKSLQEAALEAHVNLPVRPRFSPCELRLLPYC